MREFSGNVIPLPSSIDPVWFSASGDAGYWDRWCRYLGFGEEGASGYYQSAYNVGWWAAELDFMRLQLTPAQLAEELAEQGMTSREYSDFIARKCREREEIETAALIAADAEERAGLPQKIAENAEFQPFN